MSAERPTPRSHEPDWEAVRRRVGAETWATDIVERLDEDAAYWRSELDIPSPGAPSAWTHHFFCADDGAPLRFDPRAPHSHRCPRCDRTYSGEPWDGAWRTKMHNVAASQAQRSALLARLAGDPAVAAGAASELATIVEHYADHYGEYEVHGVNVGHGRVTPQNLDESIWAIALLRSVRWAGDRLPETARAAAGRLAGQVAELLEPQLGMIHNIHCWILAALAECAVRTGDEALLDRVTNGPFGVEAQIREGFRAEGLWFEVSPFYHYYTVAALLSFREAVGPGVVSRVAEEMLGRAISAPPMLAYADGRLPAYGDCWPDVRLEDFSALAAVARAVLPGCSVDTTPYRSSDEERRVQLWIGSRWEQEPSRPMRGEASVAALVFGAPPPACTPTPATTATAVPVPASFLWPDTGIAVLRSERVRLVVRFGPDSGWHDHHDKLAVDLETASGWTSLPLGTSGYGAAFTDWMRSPAAHSTGVVHDEPQPPLDGRLEAFSDSHVEATAAWGDRFLRRTLRLTDVGWDDEMSLGADDAGPLEWVFHGDGTVLADGVPTPDGVLGDLPGHAWFRDVRRLVAVDGTVTATWDAAGAPSVALSLPHGFQAFAAVADGNPTGHALGVLVVRGTARSATVRARFSVG